MGPLRSLGGPELIDRYGRTVLLHGVDLVYKIPPYEVEVQGTGRNVLTPHEAQRMAQLGFNVVRLGIIWKGLEPGTDPINDPAICKAGAPGTSGSDQFDAKLFDAYMDRLEATVSLLARYGISSLIDMHQDVYNQAFGGEGAPNWAVCTDGITPKPQRHVDNWSINYAGPGVGQAYDHFWENDVVGNLQGAFDQIWTKVAAKFRGNPWIVGYDPFNEPYGSGLTSDPVNPAFDAELECFYTGRAHPGLDQSGQRVSCPTDDPKVGLIPRIEAADPTHLVAYEGNYGTDSGVPNYIGAMDYPRLVLNFHDYCFLHVPNGPEPSNFASTCAPLESAVFTQHSEERANDATAAQPGGPGWLLTEFGATTDTADLARITVGRQRQPGGLDLLAVDQLRRSDRFALVGPVAAPSRHRIAAPGAIRDVRLGGGGDPHRHDLRPQDGRIHIAVRREPEDHRAHGDRRSRLDPLSARILPAGIGGPSNIATRRDSGRHREREPGGLGGGVGDAGSVLHRVVRSTVPGLGGRSVPTTSSALASRPRRDTEVGLGGGGS